MTMLVVDSTILAEVLKPEPSEDVLRWAREHASSIYTTAITLKELYGRVISLADDAKRAALQNRIDAIVRDYADWILPFNGLAATLTSSLARDLKTAGVSATDSTIEISAICRANGASVVTMTPEAYEHLNVVACKPE